VGTEGTEEPAKEPATATGWAQQRGLHWATPTEMHWLARRWETQSENSKGFGSATSREMHSASSREKVVA
jgi:hypothetical protein